MHRLSDVDPENRTATCAHCGPTTLKFKGYSRHDGSRVFACTGAEKQRRRGYPSRATSTMKWASKRRKYPEYREPHIGLCPICGRNEKLIFDHCHEADKFRDFICGHCNSALGFARDSPATLISAAIYLLRHKNGPASTRE